MTATHVSGPFNVYGALASGSGGTNPESGPSQFFGGIGFPDPTQPYAPGVTGKGKLYGFADSSTVIMSSGVPATLSDTLIAAAQTVTAATAMTLATTAAYGLSTKLKIVPRGSNRSAANQVQVTGLDMGFGSATMTAGSKTFSSFLHFAIGGTSRLYVGMPVYLAGAGTSGVPHFSRIASITSTTAGTLEDAAATSVTAQAMGSADENKVTPEPFLQFGAARFFDPFQGVARAVKIKSANGAASQNFTVIGYDVYGNYMSEVIAAVDNTTVAGKKAFKYIFSVTPTSTDATASAYSVGTTDVYGFNLRVDRYEFTRLYMADALITAVTGWLTADITDPATTTTGDVRGTYAVQTASNGSAVGTGRRLLMGATLPAYNLAGASPSDFKSLLGVTQV